jgi:glycosyltransferase involved in cell wall biosynthesis
MSIRLLYSSNAFWTNSGYGVQGRSLLPRLAALPQVGGVQNVAMFAWYGLQGGTHEVGGIRCYPAGADAYGNDIIGAHAQDFAANVVISLIDVWVMKETAQKVSPALWLPWLPIDHDPVPQLVLDSLQGAHRPLTYSKWGHELLAKAGVANTYIPHGVEPSVYRVLPAEQVRAFRREVLFGAEHLTVMVAANKGFPDRKAFQVQLRAWAQFAQDKPGARLYIHTEPTTMYGGIDFGALMANLGISEKCIFPDRYQYFRGLPPEYLALVYNNADVFLGAAMSEGFGIPLIEAQACGAPVVTTDFSAMPELVRWGYRVAPRDMVWTQLNAWQAWPDVDGIRDALHELYAEWHDNGDAWPLAKRLRAEAAIHGEYSWDAIVAEQWGPLMAELARTVTPAQPVRAAQPAAMAALVAGPGAKLVAVEPTAAVNGSEAVRA